MTAAMGALTAATRASAWQEAHQTGGDVEIHVEADGTAAVHEVLRWHVVRGPIHWIDLENVDPSAVLDPVVPVTSDDGKSLSARLDRRDDHGVRVTVDEPRSFARGTFTFDLRWRVDWVKAGSIVRDGSTWRLSWSSPVASDTFESARTTFDFPGAREAPAAIDADTGSLDDSALSTLRRGPARDVLELVRPHVARGDTVSWTLRIDPRALPAVVDPRLRPVAAPPAREPDRLRPVSSIAALCALALAFALLVFHKARAFAGACAARGSRPRSLLPVPDGVRAAFAGIGLAGGVALQAADELTAGSALVALTLLVAAVRPPMARVAARGPGRWLVLRPEEAFAPPADAGHWLDGSTPRGRQVAWIATALVAALVVVAHRFASQAAWLVALDAVALVPLFATGRTGDLAPDGARAAAPWLAPVFERLRAVPSLRVAPWARVVLGGSHADELRLLILPRIVMPGVVGVEIGRAWSTTPAGWAATPEVLVRVLEGSSAAAKLSQLLPRARSLPGRRGDERVVRLRPRRGTRAGTVALTRSLADALTDRRSAPAGAWDGPLERRIPRAATPRPAPSASAAPAHVTTASPAAAFSTTKAC